MNNDVAWGDSFTVDRTVDSVSADSNDALVLPSGVMNPDLLRVNQHAVRFVRDFSGSTSRSPRYVTARGL